MLIMSTQHTCERPPGDDDFYDPVEEETIKATGSGRNPNPDPNPAAWDPEKMELHRIVNWLLALEERRALAVRPAEHAVPHKVKLPGFWEKDAATWCRLGSHGGQPCGQAAGDVHCTGQCSYTSCTTCWREPEAFLH